MTASIVEYENFLIAHKGIQDTVPLKNKKDGTSLLEEVAEKYPEVLGITGKNPWEGGALHRLDHDTTGAVLFARNQKFYDYMVEIQDKNLFVKHYTAFSDYSGQLPEKVSEIKTYFRAFGPGRKKVKAEEDIKKADSSRLYSTFIDSAAVEGNRCVFKCTITRGFRHQIRVHLAYIGFPIEGDVLYNEKKSEKPLQLVCNGFEFPMPDGTYFVY